ncbi:MAG TPA: TonB-dependent receptor plug domain-containing protein, partial [Candidatus Acidoferrum sp.]|nr:TonB-dependent receptor plug domain-containing protein [Candidatus Acidoferrum sp.]
MGLSARRDHWGRATFAAVLTLLSAMTLPLAAAERSGTNAFMEMSFEDLLEVKVDRIYAASKFEQDISDAPASVSIITSDEIQRYGHRHLADVLRSVRGLYVTDDRNYSYIGVRGFARPGDYNSRVLLLIDGHRMNDNIYDSMYLGHDSVVDVDIIDRVEIIRGPSSSIYGSSAFFGVINVVTKRGAQIDGVETSFEAGSLDTYKLRATLGKKFTNDIELLLTASVYESQGQDRIHYPEFKGRTNHFGIVRDSDEERAGNFFASVRYHDLTLSGGINAREKNVPTASFETVFADGREETVDIRGYADVKYDHAFGEDTHVTGRVFYDAYRYYGTYPAEYTPG